MVSTTRSRFPAAKVTVKSAFGLRAGVRCGGRPYDCAGADPARRALLRGKPTPRSVATMSGSIWRK
jgi:hypothetical protein